MRSGRSLRNQGATERGHRDPAMCPPSAQPVQATTVASAPTSLRTVSSIAGRSVRVEQNTITNEGASALDG